MSYRVETERLTLEPYSHMDAADLSRLGDDAQVARMMTSIPRPFTQDDAARRIARGGQADSPGFLLAIRLRDGTLIGETGTDPGGEPEIMYWLGRGYWGQGYATEAAMALVGDAFSRFDVPALRGGTYDGNPASDRILEKLGFQRTERFHDDASLGRDEPASGWEWRLTRAAWEVMDRP